MAVPGPATRTNDRQQLVDALNTAVRMRVLSREQADQYLAQFDQGGGASPATGNVPRTMPSGGMSGGGLPGEQQLLGNLPATEVFPLQPEEASAQWLQRAYGGVPPSYQKGIGELADQKYWDWLLTRHRLPEYQGKVAPEDWQGFLNREMGGGGLGWGKGRQAGAEDLDWLIGAIGGAEPPAGDQVANQLWWDFQPQGGRAPLSAIQDVLSGVLGGSVAPWFRSGLQKTLGLKLGQFQALDPRKSAADIFNYAKGLGLPW